MKTASTYIIGSNIVAQLLLLCSIPILTRLYSKEEFGLFGVGTVISIVMATLLTLRLEHSIHATASFSAKVYCSCLLVIGIMSLVVLLPLSVSLFYFGPASLHENWWFIGLFALGHAGMAVGTLYLNATQRFKMIASVNILIPVVFIVGAILLSTVFDAANHLLAWQSVAYFTGAVVCLLLNARAISLSNFASFPTIIKRESASLAFLTPSSLMSIFTLNLPVLVTAFFYSEAVAGLVVLAQRLARAPITMIGNGLNEVLRSTIPARSRISDTFNKVFLISAILSVIMVVVTWLVPERFYLWLLGEQWVGLRMVLFATVFGAVFQLIATSVTSLLSSFDKVSEFKVNLVLLLVSLLAALAVWVFSIHYLAYIWLQMLLSAVVFIIAFRIAWKLAAGFAIKQAQ